MTSTCFDYLPGQPGPEPIARERDHRAIVRKAAADGIVLLENRGILPLSKDCSPALYGGGALYTIIGGTGSGSVNVRNYTNIADGLRNNGVRLANEDWLTSYEAAYKKARVDWMNSIYAAAGDGYMDLYRAHVTHPMQYPTGDPITATGTDTAIFVISRISGEGGDRTEKPGDYNLSHTEVQQLRDICGIYDHVVVVLNVGGVMDLSFMDQYSNIDALVLMSQAGQESGSALADVLTGKVNPSARLTDTWPFHYSDYPYSDTFSHLNGELYHEYYAEGIYVGYRYFDAFEVPVRYPFGYGLSYTTFTQEVVETRITDRITVSVKVTNTGSTAGRQVVQLYAACPTGGMHKERQKFVAFAKTGMLAAGASETVTMSFPFGYLASFCQQCHQYVLAAGTYALLSGAHSRSTVVAAKLTLNETIQYGEHTPILPLQDPLTELTSDTAAHDAWLNALLDSAKDVQTITLNANSVRSCVNVVPAPIKEACPRAKEVLAKLSNAEKAKLVCGRVTAGAGEFIGNASVSVPGAAGETTNILSETYGIPGLVTSDGPAGLRLQSRYEINPEDGTIYQLYGIQRLENRFFGKEFLHEGTVFHYQYCTAIPVGTMLAQTFDVELVKELGALIGREMQEFGIAVWLAPGMNIHRNPLCGRNFEYYSEDPVLSGIMAAEITKGVQAIPGKCTTIKHFACNNQEENRRGVSSVVSERALREIYLKGFEIAIRDAQPGSIMTSYNLINNVHTANSYDLCTTIARKEWGFNGFIMTDWGTTSGEIPSSTAGCIRAGNDLVMPGNEGNIQDILTALELPASDPASLSQEALDACALRMIDAMINLKNK